jgi:hypothetical protein
LGSATDQTRRRTSAEPRRSAVQAHKERATVGTTVLNERAPKQKAIALASLLKLGADEGGFDGLKVAISAD